MLKLQPGSSIVSNVERALVGKRGVIEMALAAIVANGHVLLEDVPGVGKTVLARALAVSLGASFTRIQFTPDLLPGDVTGSSIFNQETHQFEFRPGPIMTQVLLADEINRATPKTQSALLESMDERHVTVDGVTRPLPQPFIVLATQNPLEFEGTFPLPESQLDRFLISLELGYPSRDAELAMLRSQERCHPLDDLGPVSSTADLASLQAAAREVYVDDLVREYLLDVVEATRQHPDVRLGGSPRATMALYQMARARALLRERDYAIPDDVKAVVAPVLRHRIVCSGSAGASRSRVLDEILEQLRVPGNRG